MKSVLNRLAILCCLILSFACGGQRVSKPSGVDIAQTQPTAGPVTSSKDFDAVTQWGPSKLELELSDGKRARESDSSVLRPETKPLSEKDLSALLKRIPQIDSNKDDKKDFAKRAASLPAPRTGETIAVDFPPKSEEAVMLPARFDAAAPLKVVRFAPEGEVSIAPQLSVTFSQPMVEVGSHKDTLSEGIPVVLEPMPKGSWRWVGTSTLLFEPQDQRFAMASEYRMTVPKTVRSIHGATLENALQWTFQTPPVSVRKAWPTSGTYKLEQAIFIGFDQAIDAQRMLEYLVVSTGAGKRLPLELIETDRVEDATIKGLIAKSKPGTFVVVRTKKPLPYDSVISYQVKKGAPSAEGPRGSKISFRKQFRTYGPMELTKSECGWRKCEPRDTWRISFSNPIDSETFDPDSIEIEPPVTGLHKSVRGNTLYLYGMKPGRTSYRVKVGTSLRDIYGQALIKEALAAFEVGAARPNIESSLERFAVLDPFSNPEMTVYTTNYASFVVEAYKVLPNHWEDYVGSYRRFEPEKRKIPGERVGDKVFTVSGQPESMVETRVDLTPWLEKGRGQLVLVIWPQSTVEGASMPKVRPTLRTWVQATQIGLDGFVDGENFLAWATDLKDGKPLEGVELQVGPNGPRGVSDARGIAKIPLPRRGKFFFLTGRKGSDLAFLPESLYGSYGRWRRNLGGNSYRWFVFDDRKTYKPNEEVHIKGWIRVLQLKKEGDIRLPKGIGKIDYVVYGPRGNKILGGTTKMTNLGGFDFAFKLPKVPNLGSARIELSTGRHEYTHYFQIQEFRTPEFEVESSGETGPFLAGSNTTVSVQANYFAGGGLANAETRWRVRTKPAYFTPPNQEKFSFGVWTPWWKAVRNSGQSEYLTYQGKTDPLGVHSLNVKMGEISPPRPMTVTASATVTDVNRQAWGTSTSWLVHPSLHYPGLRTDTYFVEKNKPLNVEAIVSDIEGTLISGRPLKVRAGRVQWNYEKGQYKQSLVDLQTCEVTTSKQPVMCSFKTNTGGAYKITATTVDESGRLNFSQITRWVSGAKAPTSRGVEKEKVTLIPNKDNYQPGDVAKILVQSPFAPAEGLLSLRRNGIIFERRFTMKDSTTTLEVPITSQHIPNLIASVHLVGSAVRLNEKGEDDKSLPLRPAFGMGSLNLRVPPTERTLEVGLNLAQDRVSPGATTSVDIVVNDASGAPVKNAEVALVVVDEAVLALSSYTMADPIKLFYSLRRAQVQDYHLRSNIKLVDPSAMRELREGSNSRLEKKSLGLSGSERPPASARMSARATQSKGSRALMAGAQEEAEGVGGEASPIALRSNLNPLAAFVPAVSTDSAGRAQLKVTMPDNLTRYRIMAVAFSGKNRFGTQESSITARLPLMVRPSPPRFLNFGDRFEVPVIVQNQTDNAMAIKIAARGTNLPLTGNKGVQVSVPANDRVEVRFEAATDKAGVARLQVAAVSGDFSDAAEVSLPVWTPATSEAFATYGVIDEGAIVQSVKSPTQVWKQFGGLEVTTSSTALQALTDAFLYLYDYRYSCAEQIASRIIAVAALRDVLEAFGAQGIPSAEVINSSMNKDIEELFSRQNGDGGFGLWRRGQSSWPFVSLHAIHALLRAKQKGYSVSKNRLDSSNRYYLRQIERHIPNWYSEKSKSLVVAYALYLRKLMGESDRSKARNLIATKGGLDKLPFEAVGWLLHVLTGDEASQSEVKQIRRYLSNRVTQTAAGAHFVTKVSDGDYVVMHSDRRADGIVLDALIDDQPTSDLIPKLVSGLLAHRKRGRWSNTQDNAFVLLALDKYFGKYEKTTPDFVARAWLGETFMGQRRYKGRTTERHRIDVPMDYLTELEQSQDLILQKEGKGRMYYRVGMRYASKDLSLEALNQGFVVERVYEGVDQSEDVQRMPNGSWQIKAGARVKIRLTILAPTRRYHVAVVDPLPAGLEILNPALSVTGEVPQNPISGNGRGSRWWWNRPWYEHQNMRDDRIEAFASLLWGGVHTYTYYARATTPGRFVVPPAKAEEMYHPETFGRTASGRVVVID